jgi:excisionase family DNA binding protein
VAYANPTGGRLYSVQEVANLLGVHAETVRRLIHSGGLNAVRVGRVLRVEEDELERYLNRQRVKPDRPG